MDAFQRLKSLLALFVLGMASVSAYAASGVGPYYATPSWDQTLPAATRFLVLTNMNSEAVLDRETGIVWARSPLLDFTGDVSYEFASFFTISGCDTFTLGGRGGWRLPHIRELFTLADPSVPAGELKLPIGHPFLNLRLGRAAFIGTFNGTSSGTQFALVDFDNLGSTFGSSLLGGRWCVRGPN